MTEQQGAIATIFVVFIIMVSFAMFVIGFV